MIESIKVSTSNERINPDLITECDWDEGCSRLSSAINRIMADPRNRASYEAWLVGYRKRQEMALKALDSAGYLVKGSNGGKNSRTKSVRPIGTHKTTKAVVVYRAKLGSKERRNDA